MSTPTSSTSAYIFPSIYNFPPFFTLQQNPQTLSSQLQLWQSLVLDFCRHYRLFYLDVNEYAYPSIVNRSDQSIHGPMALFTNPKVGRSLDMTARRIVLKKLVEDERAVWDPPLTSSTAPKFQFRGSSQTVTSSAGGNKVLVFWRRPDEWGEMIYEWVMATGQNKSIMTFFELTEGDLAQDTEFRNLPASLLRLALTFLEKSGRAKVFEGIESGEGMGVKFA